MNKEKFNKSKAKKHKVFNFMLFAIIYWQRKARKL